MHLRSTAGYQISILIFELFFVEGGLYKYPLTNISRTAKFFPIFGFLLKVFPGSLTDFSA